MQHKDFEALKHGLKEQIRGLAGEVSRLHCDTTRLLASLANVQHLLACLADLNFWRQAAEAAAAGAGAHACDPALEAFVRYVCDPDRGQVQPRVDLTGQFHDQVLNQCAGLWLAHARTYNANNLRRWVEDWALAAVRGPGRPAADRLRGRGGRCRGCLQARA
jgi:hypothetical protein